MVKITRTERLRLLKERAATGDLNAISELLTLLSQRQENLLRKKDLKRASGIRVRSWSEGEDAFLKRYNGHFGG